MVTRFIVAAPLALALATAFVGAAVPAFAGTTQAQCEAMPGQLRAASTTAAAPAQQRAAILITTGERLCADRAHEEAGKKFAAAAHILGVDTAALAAPTVTASGQ